MASFNFLLGFGLATLHFQLGKATKSGRKRKTAQREEQLFHHRILHPMPLYTIAAKWLCEILKI